MSAYAFSACGLDNAVVSSDPMGVVARLRDETGVREHFHDQTALADARLTLDDDAFDQAWREGRAMGWRPTTDADRKVRRRPDMELVVDWVGATTPPSSSNPLVPAHFGSASYPTHEHRHS
jgi:hypothetical protein